VYSSIFPYWNEKTDAVKLWLYEMSIAVERFVIDGVLQKHRREKPIKERKMPASSVFNRQESLKPRTKTASNRKGTIAIIGCRQPAEKDCLNAPVQA
jgi:hypothetical protein